jgi:glucose/mannose-6-phosphate isomerase
MNFNDIKEVNNFDSGRVAESIVVLPDQIKDVLRQAKKFRLPTSYSKIDKVVVSGMGGSGLGARIISSVFKDRLKIPLLLEANYGVPGFVDKKTLLVISSYSGTTEETLSAYAEAKKRKAKIVVLSANGRNNKLEELMHKEGLNGFIFNPIANPSGQPRMALGYAIFALLSILEKAKVIRILPKEKESIVRGLVVLGKQLDISVNDNEAKRLALEMSGHQIFLCGGDFLEGNLHAFRNQLCENSKNMASYLVLPDMNHFALEGLSNPLNNKDNLIFLFFKSELYRSEIKKRLELTRQAVEKSGIKVLVCDLKSKTKLGQAAEVLQIGSWITFYLAFLNGVDPVKIPMVDWFKDRLAEK